MITTMLMIFVNRIAFHALEIFTTSQMGQE
jgi:hypothetical protein